MLSLMQHQFHHESEIGKVQWGATHLFLAGWPLLPCSCPYACLSMLLLATQEELRLMEGHRPNRCQTLLPGTEEASVLLPRKRDVSQLAKRHFDPSNRKTAQLTARRATTSSSQSLSTSAPFLNTISMWKRLGKDLEESFIQWPAEQAGCCSMTCGPRLEQCL